MLDELRDQLWRVLQIGIDDHHGIAGGIIEPRGHGDLLAEIPAQINDGHPGVAFLQRAKDVGRSVLAAVIDIDDFAVEIQPVQG